MTNLRKIIQSIGEAISLDSVRQTQQLFRPSVAFPTDAQCAVRQNAPYGDAERQVLDVYYDAKDTVAAKPVIIFVHGGGFVAGDKGASHSDFYANIGLWCVQHGYVCVVFNYRLAPAAQWPAVNQDIHAVLQWVEAHAGAYGGDAQRVFLWGQSAGAAHLVSWVSGWQQPPANLKGLVLCSGLFDLNAMQPQPTEREVAYFGSDASAYAAQMNLRYLVQSGVNCLFTISEWDPPLFKNQAKRLIDEYWQEGKQIPNVSHLRSHNHFSPVYAIGSGNYWEAVLNNFLHESLEG